MKKPKRKFHGKTENMGRPAMRPGERNSQRVIIRFRKVDMIRLEAEAKRAGLSLAVYLRGIILERKA